MIKSVASLQAQAAPTAARSLLPSTCLCAIVSVLGVCLSRSVFARIMQTEYTARAGGWGVAGKEEFHQNGEIIN